MAAKMEKTSHPGIYRRGGRYVVVWRHRGKQHKSFHRTLAEAREAKGQRASGDSRPASRELFTDYAERWLDTYRGRTARGLSERTRRAYRRDLELWAMPFFDHYRLADVEAPDVRAFVSHLEDSGLRPGTIRKVLAPVKAMYATAVEDGAVRSNPTREVRVGGSADPGREVRAMTRAELARFLAKAPERWVLLFELLAHTGLRISEAAGLEWRDIEFDEEDESLARLLVRRQDCRGEVGALKSDSSRRELPLSPNMARRLWKLGADQPATARVFTMEYGQPLEYSNLRRRVLLPATEAAGLGAYAQVVRDGQSAMEWRTWVTFHTFRHTTASLLFEAGRDVAQVAAWLGHTDPGFTLRTYVHLMDSGVGDASFFDKVLPLGPDQGDRTSVRVSTLGNAGLCDGVSKAPS